MKQTDLLLFDYVLEQIGQRGHWGRWESTAHMEDIETFMSAGKKYFGRFWSLLPEIKAFGIRGNYDGTGICPPMDDLDEEPQLVVSFGPLGQWSGEVRFVIKQKTEHNGEYVRLLDKGLIAVRGETISGKWREQYIVMEDYTVTQGENKGQTWRALEELVETGAMFGFHIGAHDVAEFAAREQEAG